MKKESGSNRVMEFLVSAESTCRVAPSCDLKSKFLQKAHPKFLISIILNYPYNLSSSTISDLEVRQLSR